MFRKKLSIGVGAVILSGLAACGGSAGSEEEGGDAYPSKTITVVVHGDPGSGADLFARTFTPVLSEKIGQNVVVENHPGGSSANAMNYLMGQEADGYTLVGMTDTFLINPLLNDTDYSVEDTTAISRLLVDPMVVYVRADSEMESLEQMMEHLKTNEMRWGVPQKGSPESIVIEGLIEKYDPMIKIATYEDGGQSLLGVLSGDVEVSVAEPAEIVAQMEADKVRVLGTFTSERSPSLPDVPTFQEIGYDAVIDKFRGVSGPAGMPDEVVNKLQEALSEVVEDEGYLEKLNTNMQIPSFLPPDEFASFIDDQEALYETALSE